MRGDLFGVFNAEEIAGQTDVVEIEFARLDQPLPEIGVKGLELKDDVKMAFRRPEYPSLLTKRALPWT